MKTLLLSLILSINAFAQATLTLAVPGEANTTITFSGEAVASITAAVKLQPSSPAPTMLAASTTTSSTTFTVASTAGVTAGMGAMLNGEISLITAVPSGTTLTVQRARVGTVAVATTATFDTSSKPTTPLIYVNSGSYGQFVKSIIVNWALQEITSNPGPALTAANATIAAQQAAIQAAIRAAVQ